MLSKTTSVGELVAAAFDATATQTDDPREISRLASQAVLHILERSAQGRRARREHSTHRHAA